MDTDYLASLPMDILMDWQAFMRKQGKSEGMSPAQAFEFFRKKYGTK